MLFMLSIDDKWEDASFCAAIRRFVAESRESSDKNWSPYSCCAIRGNNSRFHRKIHRCGSRSIREEKRHFRSRSDTRELQRAFEVGTIRRKCIERAHFFEEAGSRRNAEHFSKGPPGEISSSLLS